VKSVLANAHQELIIVHPIVRIHRIQLMDPTLAIHPTLATRVMDLTIAMDQLVISAIDNMLKELILSQLVMDQKLYGFMHAKHHSDWLVATMVVLYSQVSIK